MCAPLFVRAFAPVGASPVLVAARRRASMVRRRHAVAAGENERNSSRDRDERRKQHERLVHARMSLMSRREDGAPAGGLDRPGAPFPVGGGTEQPPDAIRVGPQSLMSLKSSRLRRWMVNPDRRGCVNDWRAAKAATIVFGLFLRSSARSSRAERLEG